MVERGGLENRCGRKSTEGSNPSLSAIAFLNIATHCNRDLTSSSRAAAVLRPAVPLCRAALAPGCCDFRLNLDLNLLSHL